MRFARRLLWGGLLGGGAYWFVRYLQPKHSTLVLNEKVVLITGASSGIGRALAFAFARRAARVVLVARNEERLETVRREIEPYTTDALVVPADITDDAQCQAVVDRTLEAFGRIDVLVNNAGLALGGPLQDQDADRMHQMLELNLWAAIRLTQLVLPHMLEHHHGYILNVGSSLGRVAAPVVAPYVASKYGLSGFSDALRRELAGTGVHVTLVQPSWTHTDMLNPDVEDVVERYGFQIDHPDAVAERAVLELVQGENEVILGGALVRLGVLTERYAPLLVRLYWRLRMTSEWVAAMGKMGQ
ncbi:MAG: SDR family NAD(P)-dependent oxidoreductase [Anaerolineae bacterium]|jgi:short-subunit dehydrogenase|nr:SDR family NAD(P)-dependent oxidoreductase [Anaerolineae bacterium]